MFTDNKDVLTAIKRQEESHFKMAIELGRVGNALVNIEKMITKSLATYTAENIVLQTYPNTFAANGYLYNSLFVGDAAAADNAKLVIDGIVPQYTIPLVAGENAVNIPDQATYKVTTTSNKPVTALLTRYNTPGNNDTNVTFQGSLPAGANVIGNVGINGAIPAGSNIMGKVELLDASGNTLSVAQSAGDAANGFTTLAQVPYVYNGTTYDRQREATGDNMAATGVPTSGLMAYNGTTFNRLRDVTSVPDAYAGAGLLGTAQSVWNGTSYDMLRNNSQGTLLASAARTATAVTSNQTNYNARGIALFLNVTVASGTGGLTPRIAMVDPISSAGFIIMNASTAVTTTGSFVYILYPGVSAGEGTQMFNGVLPRTFYVAVNAGDASSYTYSMSYAYIL